MSVHEVFWPLGSDGTVSDDLQSAGNRASVVSALFRTCSLEALVGFLEPLEHFDWLCFGADMIFKLSVNTP